MIKHTPGPWRVGLTVNKGDVWKGWRETDINGPEGCFLSLLQYHTAEEADANARLIAQAPAMLQVLRGCVAYFENMRHSGLTRDAAPDAQWLAPIKAILRAVDGE